MGGCGSGGSRFGGRPTVNGSCVLRLAWLRSNGGLRRDSAASGLTQWSSRGSMVASIGWRTDMADPPSLTLEYTYMPQGQEPESVRDSFRLAETRPHFGGVRWWVLCRCGRRVGQLCKPPGASRFRCRQCYRLVYECQREASEWRAYRQLEKIAKRLSPQWAKGLVPADVLDGFFLPPKPKWMRWRTYETLSRQSHRYASLQQIGAMKTLNRILNRPSRKGR